MEAQLLALQPLLWASLCLASGIVLPPVGSEPMSQAYQFHRHHLFAWKWSKEYAPSGDVKRALPH